uniref:Adenosine triphosphatase subunit 8 n=1 Tax=Ipnops sp. auip01 TaxID=172120 RepID=A0A0E4B862_9TELE|nr:adenosine triphosphatase subunit 8 [Ipnops sp. auip01]
MPQLNLGPWLSFLLLSWWMFLSLLPTKLARYLYFGPGNPHDKGHPTAAWFWPWF